MKRAVFLDRDGTINVEKSYLADPAKLQLFDDALPSLHRLAQAGFLLLIVTNQSGIGRGYYTEADMHAVNEKLTRLAQAVNVSFEQIYFAPEAPDQPSYGRKPSPQFLLDAAKDFDIDLAASFMIGDKPSDLQCGWRAGVRKSILVRTGYGQTTIDEGKTDLSEALIADSLSAAVDHILADRN